MSGRTGRRRRGTGQLIRPARTGDSQALCELWQAIDELHSALAPRFFRAAPRTTDEWRRLLGTPQVVVLVDEDETAGTINGALLARIYDTPADPQMVPQRRGYVDGLVVAAAHRRRGVGRRLMDGAAAWAKSQGGAQLVLTVWAGNEAARAFYQRLGYDVLSEVMTKPL
ncbi:MAG TPA: GNAT family N-acetyltransferase [Polyangia bacterium]